MGGPFGENYSTSAEARATLAGLLTPLNGAGAGWLDESQSLNCRGQGCRHLLRHLRAWTAQDGYTHLCRPVVLIELLPKNRALRWTGFAREAEDQQRERAYRAGAELGHIEFSARRRQQALAEEVEGGGGAHHADAIALGDHLDPADLDA